MALKARCLLRLLAADTECIAGRLNRGFVMVRCKIFMVSASADVNILFSKQLGEDPSDIMMNVVR